MDTRKIIETDYWDTDQALKGYIHVSICKRCFRILVPDKSIYILDEINTGRYAVISRGPLENRSDAFEIMFEDNSNSPFSISVTPEQFTFLPNNEWLNVMSDLMIFTKNGFYKEMPCFYRIVKRLPWLKRYSNAEKFLNLH